jgi:hypothetical protein
LRDRHENGFRTFSEFATAQQTIFSVPGADILEKGKTNLEGNELWRPQFWQFGLFP